MRRMRIVSALVVTVMLGTAVIPVYGAEAGTVVELAEEDTSTEATEEDTEGASAEATEESLTEENLPNVDESTEDVSTDMEAVVSEEDFTETEVATNRKEVQAFIERMYTKALGREADSAGVEYWTNVLIKKEKTAADTSSHLSDKWEAESAAALFFKVFINHYIAFEAFSYGPVYPLRPVPARYRYS